MEGGLVGSASLVGRVAVITGASKGLGRQMAESLAAAGAAVALVARSRSLLNEVAAGITAGGGKAEAIVADVSDDVAVADAAERVSQRLGTCDILDQQRRHQQPQGRG